MNSAEPAAQLVKPSPLPHRLYHREAGRRMSRLPAGLLGMLVLVAGIESAIAHAGPKFLDPVAWSWRTSAVAARQDAPGCDVLCLGDSLAKHGLVPRVIEEGTGRRTHNLAVAAGPAPVTYALLRAAFDAGARPKAVVFDLKPGMLAGSPRHAIRYWPQALGLADLLGLIVEAKGGSFAGELILGAVLPSFRSRHEIRGDIEAAARGETGPLRGINAVCARNWAVNAGANVATPRPGYGGAVSEEEHREHLSHRFNAHRVNAAYANRIVSLAQSHGARAYLVIPPLVPEVHERRKQTGADDAYSEFVRSLRKRHPELTVLDARRSGYPASVFVDAIHLDVRGAVALSADVAEAVRLDLDAPASVRWVDLPSFRTRAVPSGVEDVELSRERLRLAKGP
jgi:hypothetical protein